VREKPPEEGNIRVLQAERGKECRWRKPFSERRRFPSTWVLRGRTERREGRLPLRAGEGAGITVTAAVLVPFMFLAGLVLFDVTAFYGARGRARTAADAAAKAAGLELTPLFGVGIDPGRAALEYAARNGCELETCELGRGGNYVWVTVTVSREIRLVSLGGKRVRARATARCYLDLSSLYRPLEGGEAPCGGEGSGNPVPPFSTRRRGRNPPAISRQD
jgi:hypothetical protein